MSRIMLINPNYHQHHPRGPLIDPEALRNPVRPINQAYKAAVITAKQTICPLFMILLLLSYPTVSLTVNTQLR